MARGSQLQRQWQLLRVLESNRFGVNIEELAERTECSRRTIERDLGILQKMGFPIHAETRDYGKKFWRLQKHFLESDQLVLGPTELVSMYMARELMKPLSGTCFGKGMEELWGKIKTLLPAKALSYFMQLDESILVRLRKVKNGQKESPFLEPVQRAIEECKVLKLTYSSYRDDKGYEMDFHPYGLYIL